MARRGRSPRAWSIAADGRRSTIAFGLGLARHPARPRRWAVGAYFENFCRSGSDPDPTSGTMGSTPTPTSGEDRVRPRTQHLGDGARCTSRARKRYIGVAPVPGGLTNVCLVRPSRPGDADLRDPAALLTRVARRAIRCCATARRTRVSPDRLSSSVRSPSTWTAPSLDGLLLAGDAAGFIDPMTGDGLRFAVRGGELAAAAALRRARTWMGGRPPASCGRAPARVRGEVALQPGAARAGRVAARDRRRYCRRAARPARLRADRHPRRRLHRMRGRRRIAGRVRPGTEFAGRGSAGDGGCITLIAAAVVVFGFMLVEALRAARNERAQRALGGVEPAGDVYRWMQIAYPASFAAMFARRLSFAGLTAVRPVGGRARWSSTLAKALKWWAILTLGRFWTFRVIVVPGAPLVRRGPYRFLAHPNYVGVLGELVGVGLLTGAFRSARLRPLCLAP